MAATSIAKGASLLASLALAAGCAATSTQAGQTPSHDSAQPVASSSAPDHDVATQGENLPKWCASGQLFKKTVSGGAPALELDGRSVTKPGATITEININGDADLELFVRDGCQAGKPCAYQVYAACGNGEYALIPATGLVGDRLDTSNHGILIDDVYWRDVYLYQFLTKGDRLGEERIRFRYDGIAYHRHELAN